jgi:hypothetical protein
MSNVCVVGNGACALREKSGDFINSCEIVIRLGEFVTKGYEEFVGSKTNIYVSRWRKCKTRPKEFFSNLLEFWIPRTFESREEKYDHLIFEYDVESKIKYIPSSLIFSYKARYPYRYVKNNNGRRGNRELYCCIPDSGIVAIDMARYFFPNSTLWITGFDNCSSGYYWDVNKKLDLIGDDLLNLQLRYLQEIVKTKQVTDISRVL